MLVLLVEEFRRRFAALADSYPADEEIDPDDNAVPFLEDGLYKRLAIVLQEARWAILIHDGQASEVVGTIRGGEGLLKFLQDDRAANSEP